MYYLKRTSIESSTSEYDILHTLHINHESILYLILFLIFYRKLYNIQGHIMKIFLQSSTLHQFKISVEDSIIVEVYWCHVRDVNDSIYVSFSLFWQIHFLLYLHLMSPSFFHSHEVESGIQSKREQEIDHQGHCAC